MFQLILLTLHGTTILGMYHRDSMFGMTGGNLLEVHYVCSTVAPYCGDLNVNSEEEECDDGGTHNSDGCSSDCLLEGRHCGQAWCIFALLCSCWSTCSFLQPPLLVNPMEWKWVTSGPGAA